MSYGKNVLSFRKYPQILLFTVFNIRLVLQLGYIWLLLVFSYMILFRLVPPSDTGHTFHWTELYTIITISTMLIEDIRRVRI
jgi:hypothetical protein